MTLHLSCPVCGARVPGPEPGLANVHHHDDGSHHVEPFTAVGPFDGEPNPGQRVPTLWHYTCQHGRDALGDVGHVRVLSDWRPQAAAIVQRSAATAILADLSWFTDLERPDEFALGLTRLTIDCDRTQYRYRVTDAQAIAPWVEHPARNSRVGRHLEAAPGAMPRHWYVAQDPIPVTYDPLPPGRLPRSVRAL